MQPCNRSLLITSAAAAALVMLGAITMLWPNAGNNHPRLIRDGWAYGRLASFSQSLGLTKLSEWGVDHHAASYERALTRAVKSGYARKLRCIIQLGCDAMISEAKTRGIPILAAEAITPTNVTLYVW